MIARGVRPKRNSFAAPVCASNKSSVKFIYYESIGLLKRARRTAGNYRSYTQTDIERLRRICTYRAAGLTLAGISQLLDGPSGGAAAVLERRLVEIDEEIARLRIHQRSILNLLRKRASFRRHEMLTKDKLVSIMRAAGLTDDDMHRFHTEFERSAPEEHQEFLEFLKIPEGEINQIRALSRGPAEGR